MVQGGQVGVGVTPAMEIQYHMSRAGDLDYEQLIRLDEQLIRERNRAKKSQIDALPIVKAGKEDKEIRCCVCMCDVEEGEELRVLPCSHKYHMSCIDSKLFHSLSSFSMFLCSETLLILCSVSFTLQNGLPITAAAQLTRKEYPGKLEALEGIAHFQ